MHYIHTEKHPGKDRVDLVARSVELKIYTDKAKLMKVKTRAQKNPKGTR